MFSTDYGSILRLTDWTALPYGGHDAVHMARRTTPGRALSVRDVAAQLSVAEKTVYRSFWAGAYYRQQRNKGAAHHVAVRALAFKWIRILYRCWQNRRPYDESAYLNALKRRGSPLLEQHQPTG